MESEQSRPDWNLSSGLTVFRVDPNAEDIMAADHIRAGTALLQRLLAAALLATLLADQAAAQVETPLDVLAVRVREQGYPCDNPINAVRDEAASQPNRTVWRLQCSNASYRVVLHPDMAADIEVLN
ncbi:MAG: hypothetical protein DIU57_008725 [Pseudomonadota bacterium]